MDWDIGMVGRNELSQFNDERKRTEMIASPERQTEEDVILFFSFDVVNSTAYKRINYFGWSEILLYLFKKLRSIVEDEVRNSELWRTIGDETVFVVRIAHEEEIFDNVDKIFKILITAIKEIKDGSFFNEESWSDEEIKEFQTQNIISLQSTAWIAVVARKGRNGKTGEIVPENFYEEYPISSNYRTVDFIGNDIDAGFRVAQYTGERRLALSFELASILSEKSEFLEYLHLISYKSLKGIWDNRLYPIFWYHNPKHYDEVNFEHSFYYDDFHRDALSKEYISHNKQKNLDKYDEMLEFKEKDAISKILKDLNLYPKINHMRKAIRGDAAAAESYLNMSLLELHCVAVCISAASGKVFIAKRAERKNMNDKWEFGCAKADIKCNIEETLIKEYKKEFGLDIKIHMDERRTDRQPIPLAVYNISKGENWHKGLIFLAMIDNKSVGSGQPKTKRYSECKWIDGEEAKKLEKEAIPDFAVTVQCAINLFQKWNCGEE